MPVLGGIGTAAPRQGRPESASRCRGPVTIRVERRHRSIGEHGEGKRHVSVQRPGARGPGAVLAA